MTRVVIAAGSQTAADSGAQIAEDGGNAIDAAIGAAMVLMISEPGICAPGAGGFITLRRPGEHPVTVDANVAMPGLGVDPARFGVFSRQVSMEYGGGVTTVVGYESIAIPGGLAGLGEVWTRWGRAPWAEVLAPAVALARVGIRLSEAAHVYLGYAHDQIFGWHPISHASIHDAHGELLKPGSVVEVPGLADTLTELGERGARDFYQGEIARVLVKDLVEGGSLITAADLAAYMPTIRPALRSTVGPWDVYTCPPPSIGGVTLTAMLELATASFSTDSAMGYQPPTADQLIASQAAVLRYRRDHLDRAEDLGVETKALLDRLADGDHLGWISSPSTVHASAVGDDGSACSITMSAGYGSGVVAGSTGMWMNNSLGEAELNRRGFHTMEVGAHLPSNMAPTIAIRQDGAVLSVGSPGADRITTALQQVLLAIGSGRDLQGAVDAPRLHVEPAGDKLTVAYEAGLALPSDVSTRCFDEPHMFFGAVAAAMFDPDRGLTAAADLRRGGGVANG